VIAVAIQNFVVLRTAGLTSPTMIIGLLGLGKRGERGSGMVLLDHGLMLIPRSLDQLSIYFTVALGGR
jgi:hypothetical protein